MQKTTKLNLNKPELTEFIMISDLNENMDILDEAVGELKEGSAEISELKTANKTLAGAINELNAREVDLTPLETKINEVKSGLTTHTVDYVSHAANGGTTAGTATAYTCNSSPNPTALVDKIGLMITAHVDSGSNPTLKWGTLVAKSIKKPNGNAASLKKDGLYTLRYNSVNDSFILQGEGGEYGNVTVNDVRKGVQFGTDDGLKIGELTPTWGKVDRFTSMAFLRSDASNDKYRMLEDGTFVRIYQVGATVTKYIYNNTGTLISSGVISTTMSQPNMYFLNITSNRVYAISNDNQNNFTIYEIDFNGNILSQSPLQPPTAQKNRNYVRAVAQKTKSWFVLVNNTINIFDWNGNLITSAVVVGIPDGNLITEIVFLSDEVALLFGLSYVIGVAKYNGFRWVTEDLLNGPRSNELSAMRFMITIMNNITKGNS